MLQHMHSSVGSKSTPLTHPSHDCIEFLLKALQMFEDMVLLFLSATDLLPGYLRIKSRVRLLANVIYAAAKTCMLE